MQWSTYRGPWLLYQTTATWSDCIKKKPPKGKATEIIHIRRFMPISDFPKTLQLLAHFGKGEGLTSKKHKVKFSYDVCLEVTRQGTI